MTSQPMFYGLLCPMCRLTGCFFKYCFLTSLIGDSFDAFNQKRANGLKFESVCFFLTT
uniref:Uncharacterized protein n=1 Tax=Anguilla anguilla TaxID=7936 RepID=A0A0E9SX72_ANGAN